MMNKDQRAKLEEAKDIVAVILDEEDEKLCNMEEKFSETQKYQDMDENKDNIQEILDAFDVVLERS